MRADELIDEVERLLAHAKPVPLTEQVRIDPQTVRDLLGELREALAAERRDRRYGSG